MPPPHTVVSSRASERAGVRGRPSFDFDGRARVRRRRERDERDDDRRIDRSDGATAKDGGATSASVARDDRRQLDARRHAPRERVGREEARHYRGRHDARALVRLALVARARGGAQGARARVETTRKNDVDARRARSLLERGAPALDAELVAAPCVRFVFCVFFYGGGKGGTVGWRSARRDASFAPETGGHPLSRAHADGRGCENRGREDGAREGINWRRRRRAPRSKNWSGSRSTQQTLQ